MCSLSLWITLVASHIWHLRSKLQASLLEANLVQHTHFGGERLGVCVMHTLQCDANTGRLCGPGHGLHGARPCVRATCQDSGLGPDCGVVCAQGDRVGVCVAGLDAACMERGLACAPGSVPTFRAAVAAVEKIRFHSGALPSRGRVHVTVGHTTQARRRQGMQQPAKASTRDPAVIADGADNRLPPNLGKALVAICERRLMRR